VFTAERHLQPGEEEPPVSNTKQRLDSYIEHELPGPASWWRSTTISTSFWSGFGPSRRMPRSRPTSKNVTEQPMPSILADVRNRCSEPRS
jgi:hypothetical protein